MNKIRYPYTNNPFGFELPKSKPVIHPVIEKWEDFSNEDKIILLEIKKIINSYISDCKVYVFGSRIKGNWDDESDYDISIITQNKDMDLINKIRNHNYSVEVDIKFGIINTMVEIQ